MNTVTDAFVDQDAAADAPRLREIPYNYTSFSDREIVIRLLGRADVAAARRAARRAPHRALGAHAVRGAGRHLGRRAQSLPAGRPARQSDAAAAAGRRAAPPPARDRQAARGARRRRRRRATRKVAQLDRRRARAPSTASPRAFAATARLAQAHAARADALHAPRTTSRSTASRASRTSPTPPTGASSIRSSCCIPDTEDEVRGAGRRAASSSASRSFRAAAAPATPAARFRSTRARR